MTKIADLKARWMRDPDFAREHAAQAFEFAVAETLIAARKRAGLTQAEIAELMNTSQPQVARMESGANFGLDALRRFADATGAEVKITLEHRS